MAMVRLLAVSACSDTLMQQCVKPGSKWPRQPGNAPSSSNAPVRSVRRPHTAPGHPRRKLGFLSAPLNNSPGLSPSPFPCAPPVLQMQGKVFTRCRPALQRAAGSRMVTVRTMASAHNPAAITKKVFFDMEIGGNKAGEFSWVCLDALP